MAQPYITYRGAQVGDWLVTLGGNFNRGGEPIITDTLGAVFAEHLELDSPNKKFVFQFIVAFNKSDQYDMEENIWAISDLAGSPKANVLLYDESGSLKRTYPNVSLLTVNWTPQRDPSANRFNEAVRVIFLGTERPVSA